MKRWAVWAAAGLLLAAGVAFLRCGPLPRALLDPAPRLSAAVVDRKGRPLYERLSRQEARSTWLEPASIPPLVEAATLAAEDHRFYRHPGVDPVALLRAAWNDLRAGRIREGGSTLTQQAVKRLTGRPRTAAGKLREMVLALRLEHRLDKRQILALYLNVAPYGNQAEGIGAASRTYFGCDPGHLTPAQAAFLAGLPQRPSAFNPYRHFREARARQRWVLARMAALGSLDGEGLRRALEERIVLRRPERPFLAPHFVERVLERCPPGTVRVRTTLDLDLQGRVNRIVEAGRRDREAHGASAAAVVVLHNATGEILAYEGSGDYFAGASGGAIDGARTPRQPGSALKPFTYALAFDSGFTPASVLPDLPQHFPTAEEGVVYSPRNYDGRFRGPLRAREALAGSENVPAVVLLSRLGAGRLLSLLRALGLSTLDRTASYYGFGLTLGDAEVRLDELCGAYAALARGGLYLPLRDTLEREGGEEGEALPPPQPRRLLSPLAAYWTAHILADPEARAWAFGRGGSLDFPFPVCAKTGTSQAYRDNWCLGFTREVTVGVWVGNFDGRPLKGASGVTGAAPLFHEVLLEAQRHLRGGLPGPLDPFPVDPPEGLVPVEVCALSGGVAGPFCPSRVSEAFPRERIPEPCRWHLPSGRVAWPSEYRAWARSAGRLTEEESRLAAPAAPPAHGKPPRPLDLVSPPEGAVYLLDPTLPPTFQTLPLRASVSGPPRRLTWTVDGREVGRCSSEESLEWPLSRGEHTVEVRDGQGNGARGHIAVR
ncbi:MAG: penicillin-binding protein 1C [Acidobacteriota bacterium]